MGKRRVLFFFIAICSGVVFGFETFFQTLVLRSLEIECGDPVAESFFWRSVSPVSLRFWPLFFLEKEDLIKKIETEAPLTCSIARRGLSGFDVRIEPLKPWVVARWANEEFFVTRDGAAWTSSHPLNEMLEGIVRPEIPLLVFKEDFPPPSGDRASSIILRAVFPLNLISEWLEGLEENRWISRVERIKISRREGQYLLELVFDSAGAHVLLRGERSRWRELSSALSQVMEHLHFLGENVIIDTTYTDRIIVRSMVRGDQEGSGK